MKNLLTDNSSVDTGDFMARRSVVRDAPHRQYGTIRWILTSQLLLAVYLAFFHSVLGKGAAEILYTGIAFSVLATAIVVVCRRVFFNRFEYLIHFVIGLDILCEAFVPYHQTFGFYYCALAFWTVFWGYHGFQLYRRGTSSITT